MYINQIDELFDSILNKLNEYLNKEGVFKKLNLDTNFVKYQNDILNYIKKFIDTTLFKKNIMEIIKKESYYESFINIIKRYCAFYIYLGIGYYYTGGRDLFITNIIETSRYQKDAVYQIPHFFNSENNFKIITYYNDIKNFISLALLKDIDKIKNKLITNPQIYETTIKLFNEIGEDYIVEYFLINDNFHNILKTIIFRFIYFKEDKNEIITILNQQDEKNIEYKYIEVVISNQKKIVDFNIIQKFLTLSELKSGIAEEIYNYLEEYRDTKENIQLESKEYINYLFENQIIIPITEDFLRFHKDTEKYDTDTLINTDIKERFATKIKYIINKMNLVKNYNSPMLDKNPKLKLDTEKLFFKPLYPRQAVIYNDNEEVKIIQKLESSENALDYDLLIDLINIRKYAYVNYKNFSKDGIKIRPRKIVQGIRQTSLIQTRNIPLETRIGHENLDMNVIGIALNPSKKPFECFNFNNLINVREKNTDNGYLKFINYLKKTINGNNKKIYYWLFDNKIDKPLSQKYINYSISNVENNIKIMMEEIYNNYINIIKYKIKSHIKSFKELSFGEIHNLFKYYKKNYFNFDLTPNIKNKLIENIILNKIIELEIIPDEVDSIIPGRKVALFELPTIKIYKEKKNIVKIGKIENDEVDILTKTIPVCNHYIRWRNIHRLGKKSDEFNQAVFDFVKQYVITNDRGDYVCKSCNENVRMQKLEGTYDEELNSFLITSIAISPNLEDIPKYSKYMRIIRNIGKNIEKYAYSMDILIFLGNSPASRDKRKMMIKDIIDLVLVHSEWLKTQPKNRIEQYSQKFGINKDLTNLFFFELKDEIFLTSSTDTDQYKIIKYNNIMAYLICIIITEMNSGQILNLKEDKRINYIIFQKIGAELFANLYLRIAQQGKIPIMKLPLLAYIIYYLSGMMVYNRLWLYNDSNIDVKKKTLFLINVQKTIIHTVIDLLNSLIEAHQQDKNYIYELINTRLNVKIKNVYYDAQLLKRFELKTFKNINYDETTKKIMINANKIDYISLDIETFDSGIINSTCNIKTTAYNKNIIRKDNNTIDNITNCLDGNFHKWIYKKNDLICGLCNVSYNETIKHNITSTENNSNEYLNKLKYINLIKLTKKYCISGDFHDTNNNGECSKCKKNVNTFEPSTKELKQFEINLTKKTDEDTIKKIKNMKEINKNININKSKIKETITEFNKEYEKIINNKFENYVNSFIDRLVKILGPKIKMNDKIIYLKDTVYIINHDYLGNIINSPIYILSSDNKIQFTHNHASFNKDVIYYRNKSNNIYIYYDPITLQYLGYSENNKDIKKNKNNPSLEKELSLKDCILYLGYDNQYYNIFYINNDFQNNIPKILNKEYILKIIRNRINNLKQILVRIQSVLNNIINNGVIISNYNINEKVLIEEFSKKLKNINIKDIFINLNLFLSNIHIYYNIPSNFTIPINHTYIDVNIINSINNTDIKLIYYLIDNFNKILDLNKQPAIQSEITHLITKIIKFVFNIYYKPFNNYNIRKFNYILLNESPDIDESLKVSGHYQELLTQQEIDDPLQEEEQYSNEEAKNSLDIDDYEVDDDIDGTMEALDGYE